MTSLTVIQYCMIQKCKLKLGSFQKIIELEKSLQNQEDQNRSLQEQVHRSQRMDAQNQDHMETKQLEIASFKKALNDAKVKISCKIVSDKLQLL